MPATNVTQSSSQSPPHLTGGTSMSSAAATSSPQDIVTTTITSGTSLPTAVVTSQGSDIPVAAIAGGTAAGVFLAFVAVMGWTWWGRCIKRRRAKDRKEALAVLQVRENTRKNASSLSHSQGQYRPSFSIRHHEKKITFASSSSNSSTLKEVDEPKRSRIEKDPLFYQKPPPYVPSRPSPLAKSTPGNERPLPPAPPSRSVKHGAQMPIKLAQGPTSSTTPPSPRSSRRGVQLPIGTDEELPPAVPRPRLAHQPSTLSSGSVYSTQSAMEERQRSVPSSLIMALSTEDVRRSLLASYIPFYSRLRPNSGAEGSRLSEYSAASADEPQADDQPWVPVGYAYGGEEGATLSNRG
ncbi:hypothetical protein A0H81_04694 [Grifola frondosa]|uniref:Uncharacterized protein n=1 Tax=Grifola frondosa TaxID=5627 RepID=A0A1C7MFV9_GRIFR|nr:hypothetical protein A0H81_04694 [Grifola frondosa]